MRALSHGIRRLSKRWVINRLHYMRPLAERTGECIDRRLSSDPFTRQYYDGEGKLHGRIYVGQDTKEELDWNVKWYGSMGRDESDNLRRAKEVTEAGECATCRCERTETL